MREERVKMREKILIKKKRRKKERREMARGIMGSREKKIRTEMKKKISTRRTEIFLFYFQTTFPQAEHLRHSKPKREKEQPKREGRRRSYGKKLKRKKKPPESAFSLFYSLESPRLGSHCLTVLAIACLGQPIKPFRHFHFGGSCCPSSCILHFLALDSPLCLLFWRVLLLFLCIVPENKIM